MYEVQYRSTRKPAARAHGPTQRYSRLPTPDASEYNYETLDSDSQDDRTKKSRHIQNFRRPPLVEGLGDSESFPRPSLSRRDSCNQSMPNSPLYQPSETQRPSLPPLKTVLGDNMSSPPNTPSLRGTSTQPSPQEPAIVSATYKPPSLYPNKRPRTNFVLEPVPPITTPSGFSSPGVPSTAFDSNGRGILTNTTFTFPFRPSQSNLPRIRLHSGQQQSNFACADALPYTAPHSQTPQPECALVDPDFQDGRQDKQPGPAPVMGSSQLDRTRVDLRSDSNWDAFPGREHGVSFRKNNRANFRRSSVASVYEDYYNSSHFEPDRDRRLSYDVVSRREPPHHGPFMEREMRQRLEQDGFYTQRTSGDVLNTPYTVEQPSYFVPNHYDIQQGKTRKRSNLPKQSTEIMKSWFDQNIGNPYPTEEQKAIFSNATGISMTQVSNWFINHRRRCPELRDKRESIREREVES